MKRQKSMQKGKRNLEGKRAYIFNLFMLITLIIILTSAFIILGGKYKALKGGSEKKTGEAPFNLFRLYEEGEKAQLFTDIAAKYAVEDAIYNFGDSGGYNAPECGSYNGYNLWHNRGQGCYLDAEKEKENFGEFFGTSIKKRASGYSSEKFAVDFPNSFDISFQENFNGKFIAAKSTDSLVVASKEYEVQSLSLTGSSDCGNKIVQLARSKIGISAYTQDLGLRLNQQDKNTFDCSGFVYWLFGNVGTIVPMTSVMQAKWGLDNKYAIGEIGPSAKFDDDSKKLLPGDIVFFEGANPHNLFGLNIGHVGIYSGNGMMVHAAGTAYGVIESSIDIPERRSTYRGAIRVCSGTGATSYEESTKNYIGKTYALGGRDGEKIGNVQFGSGIDSIGLQYIVMKSAGLVENDMRTVQIFTNAQAVYSLMGSKIPSENSPVDDLNDLKEGDLLFFAKSDIPEEPSEQAVRIGVTEPTINPYHAGVFTGKKSDTCHEYIHFAKTGVRKECIEAGKYEYVFAARIEKTMPAAEEKTVVLDISKALKGLEQAKADKLKRHAKDIAGMLHNNNVFAVVVEDSYDDAVAKAAGMDEKQKQIYLESNLLAADIYIELGIGKETSLQYSSKASGKEDADSFKQSAESLWTELIVFFEGDKIAFTEDVKSSNADIDPRLLPGNGNAYVPVLFLNVNLDELYAQQLSDAITKLFQKQGAKIAVKPTSEPDMKLAEVTKYYTPYEGDFSSGWCSPTVGHCIIDQHAAKAELKGVLLPGEYSSLVNCIDVRKKGMCCIPKRHRGFYEEVMCQGSGMTKEGSMTMASSTQYKIAVTKAASKFKENSRGSTKTGTEPTAHRTIAVDPSSIPLSIKDKQSTVYLYFGECEKCKEWNGCYAAEDIGYGITGSHIDLYAGVGEQALLDSAGLAATSDIWITDCEPGEGSSSLGGDSSISPDATYTYSLKLAAKEKMTYDFAEYDAWTIAAKKLAERIDACLGQSATYEDIEACAKENAFDCAECAPVKQSIKESEDIFGGFFVGMKTEMQYEPKYRTEKPAALYGIILEDDFPPKASGLRATADEDTISLSWDKTSADTAKFKLFYHPNTKKNPLDLKTAKEIGELDSSKTSLEIGSGAIGQLKSAITFTSGDKPCFAILAYDEVDNAITLDYGNYFCVTIPAATP